LFFVLFCNPLALKPAAERIERPKISIHIEFDSTKEKEK
jgi:hypothetical protein